LGVAVRIARRSFIAGLGAVWVGAGAPSLADSTLQKYRGDKKDVDDWMHSWMAATKKVNGTLHVSRFADPIYFLTQAIEWEPDANQAGKFSKVTVPVGFVTDFASIPRIFWSLLRPDGLYTYPAIVHDYLYWMQAIPRDDADLILDAGMEDFGVDKVTRFAIYEPVHLFGNAAWQENSSLKANGEKRILAKTPNDPTITWEHWKQDPANFV
jgi:Protein of unknown function (DUF1353)